MINITNESVTEYLNGFYTQSSPELLQFRRESEQDIPIIQKTTEDLIRTLLLLTKPKRILEIGTATGYSAAVMASIVPECKITTVEQDLKKHEAAKENFKALNISHRIDAKLGNAVDVIDSMEKQQFDFIFIDAAKSHYRKFWDSAIKHAAPKATILCDNVLMKASVADESYDKFGRHKTSIKRMRDFLDYITKLEDIDTTVLAVGDGVSISMLKR